MFYPVNSFKTLTVYIFITEEYMLYSQFCDCRLTIAVVVNGVPHVELSNSNYGIVIKRSLLKCSSF